MNRFILVVIPFLCTFLCAFAPGKVPITSLMLAPQNSTIIKAWSYYRHNFPERAHKYAIYKLLRREQKNDKRPYRKSVYILVSFENYNSANPFDPQLFRLYDPEAKNTYIPQRYFLISKQPGLGKSSHYQVDLYVYKFDRSKTAGRQMRIEYTYENKIFRSKKPFYTNNGLTIDMVSP